MALTCRALRSRVERAFTQWRPILGLESWGITLLYDEREHLATAEAKPAYEEATLHFNLPAMKGERRPPHATDEEITVHEMVHVLNWRGSERTTSRITRALLRARDVL